MDADIGGRGAAVEIAGFWRRLVALAVDLFLLGVAGMIVGGLLFDALARMGGYARLPGFALALLYFGLCNSRLRGGQTVGKMLLGIRVVDRAGAPLSVPRAMLRYAVLGVPCFLNGAPVLGPDAPLPLDALLSLLVFGGLLGTAYLYVFNRRTRQTLHDLAVGSCVVRAEPGETRPVAAVWRGHYVVLGLLAVLALGLPLALHRLAGGDAFAGMLPAYRTLSREPHVLNALVMRGSASFNGTGSRYLQASLRLDAPLLDDAGLARRAAGVLAASDDGRAEDAFVVILVYGYDMGIAHGWKYRSYTYRPDELR